MTSIASSFHIHEQGAEHSAPMRTVPGPEGLLSNHVLRHKHGQQHAESVPARVLTFLHAETAIEIREVEPLDLLDPPPRPARSDYWFRAADHLPDDPVLHQAMLAYSSDFGLLRSALLPHGLSFLKGNVQGVSLDHAMWFHAPFRMDEWLLYSTESPFAGGARGFCRGSIFTHDGRLVASVAQEGLMRPVTPKPAAPA